MRKTRTISRRAPAARAPRRASSLGLGFEALYECEPLGMATLSPDGIFLKTNDALQRIVGYTQEELRARHFNDITHPQDIPACVELFLKLQRGEIDNFEMEKRYFHKSGRLIWVHVIVAAVREGGQLVHTVGVAIDITARKEAEQALRASEERYRSLYGRTPAMLLSLDREGRIVGASDLWLEALGRSPEQARGRPLSDFLTSESRRYFVEAVLPALRETGACADAPLRLTTSGGQIMEALLSATLERDGDGGAERAMAVVTDVTERKRAEEKVWRLTVTLEESVRQRTSELAFRNALLAAQAEASPDSIYVVDAERRILWWNKRCVEIWGLTDRVIASRDDRLAMRLAMRQIVGERGSLAKRIDQLYGSDKDSELHEEVTLAGARTVEVDTRPLIGADGTYFGRVWFTREETRRARAESALRESNADLDAFASTAAHDLLSPVRKILSFSDLLRARIAAKIEPAQLDILDRVIKSAAALERLVRDVLALSRIGREGIPLEEVDLNLVAAEVVSDLEAGIKDAGAQLEVGALPVVRAHPSYMRRLLYNLIANAVKFRRKDTPLRVVLAGRSTSDGGVEVSVSDNGIGFDPKLARAVFEPFRRLNPVTAYEGSGLGLAICQRIAGRYGGRMRADSRPGRGSTFVLRLPKGAIVRGPGAQA